MNELELKLQDLAIKNWAVFIAVMGDNAMTIAKAKILRKEGKSYYQIGMKLHITEAQARYACNKKAC